MGVEGGGLMNESPPRLFFFFAPQVGINSHTPIPLFKPGSVHSGSASLFPDQLRVSSFS